MKHRISAVIACILAGVLLTACSLESVKTEEKTLPKITIGGAIYKPYFYKDVEENYTGIDVELAKEACARLGYRPVRSGTAKGVVAEWEDRLYVELF